jgi:hypothetical protein
MSLTVLETTLHRNDGTEVGQNYPTFAQSNIHCALISHAKCLGYAELTSDRTGMRPARPTTGQAAELQRQSGSCDLIAHRKHRAGCPTPRVSQG